MPHRQPKNQEILSQDFDCQSAALDASVSELSASDRQLLASWQLIGDCLRQIPVVSTDLASSVRHECALQGREPVVSVDSSVVAFGAPPVRSVHGFARTTAVLTAVASVLVVAFMVLTDGHGLQRDAHIAALANRASDLPAISSFGDPAKWDVVLVTVPDGDDRQLVQQLRQSFEENGLQVHSGATDNVAAGSEVAPQIASSIVSGELFDVLTGENKDVETEWNPEQIDDLDRDELLARFVDSMKTPSRSDEHFGEMVVVFSQETMDAIELAVGSGKISSGAAAIAAVQSAGGSSVAADEHVSRDTKFEIAAGDVSRRPVLVVVRRKKDVAPLVEPQARQHGLSPSHLDSNSIAESSNYGRFV